jgi:hypothetical protein
MVISRGSWGIFGILRMPIEPWCKKIGAYVKIGNFSGVLVKFWRA